MALKPLSQAPRTGSPLIAQKSTADADTVLDNGEFWPVVSVRDFDLRYGTDDTYSEERRIHCLTQAMMRVNSELQAWSCEQVNQGYHTLADVPSSSLGNCSEKTQQYHSAVYAHAMGLLERRFWSSADSVGKDHSPDDMEASADEYHAERWEMIRLIQDQPRCISGAL